jgi:hypothetical protein
MKSFRQIEQIVGRVRLRADPATDGRVLSDADAALAEMMNHRPSASRPGPAFWRTIMESKATKYSVAATIILTAALVLWDPLDFSGSRHGVVLGDVAQKLSETRTVTHKERRIAWSPGADKPFFDGEVRKYVSTDLGLVEEQYDPNGILLHRFHLLKEQQQAILVLPQSKQYLKFAAPARIYEELCKMATPGGMVNYFTALPYTKLGRSHFDGFDAEGFEVNHFDVSWLEEALPLHLLFPVRDMTARLWVDVDTSLPVRIEIIVDAGRGLLDGFRPVHAEFTAYDFQWDPEIPVATFDPNIPADYTQIDPGSIATEKAAWLGVGAVPAVGFAAYRRRHPKKGVWNPRQDE